jgi:Protein of unknown function (DUF3124)
MLLALLAWLTAANARAEPNTGLLQNFANSLTTMPTQAPTVSGSFYVPVYSSVSMTPGKVRADFSVTLSVHNASESQPLILKRISYFDTSGALVQAYLKEPVALKPFARSRSSSPSPMCEAGRGPTSSSTGLRPARSLNPLSRR